MLEILIIISNCGLAIATIHAAHRALPEQHKHWIRHQVRRVVVVRRVKRDDR